MIDYSRTYQKVAQTSLVPWLSALQLSVETSLKSGRWGDLSKWFDAVEALPNVQPSSIDLDSAYVRAGFPDDIDAKTRQDIQAQLRVLMPWRKGPFDLFGVKIDTEWRSDLKWDRLKNDIASLKDRLVLDVGCGNGYHCWRASGAGAKLVVGVDPTMLYPLQFQAIQKYIRNDAVNVFPIGIDDLPQDLPYFDTVFSMGLLYHRRSPFDHLLHLKSLLREGGELVLETLVIEGCAGDVLSPTGRYAMMPNVWFIPSVPTLESWLARMQFKNVRVCDLTPTKPEEQQVTDWMEFQSLEDFLDPVDPTKTVEGYPAPRRAVILAEKP